MYRAVELPRAKHISNMMDWLKLAAERNIEIDVYALSEANELRGIREEIMNSGNVWLYQLDPRDPGDGADDSDDDVDALEEEAVEAKDRYDGANEDDGKGDPAGACRAAKLAMKEDEPSTLRKRIWYLVLAASLLIPMLTSLADMLICVGPRFLGRKHFC